MTTKLAAARTRVLQLEAELDKARAELQKLAVSELRRDVSAARIAKEIGMTRATVSGWAKRAGLRLQRPGRAEPLEANE